MKRFINLIMENLIQAKYYIIDTTHANDQQVSRKVFKTNSIAEAFRAYEKEKERVPSVPGVITSVVLWSRREGMIICRAEIGNPI